MTARPPVAPPPPRPSWRIALGWLGWIALFGGVTLLMLALRDRLDKAHIALAYLLVVLGASARRGRALGLLLSVLSFAAFNLLFLPPYYTFVIANPLDWLALFAFLATSTVATQLLYRAQAEAEAARRRAREVDRLAAVGAEAINAARADDALAAIAAVIRETLDLESCDVYLREDDGRLCALTPTGAEAPAVPGIADWVAANARAALEGVDGVAHLTAAGDDLAAAAAPAAASRVLYLPLLVHDRVVGVLRVTARHTLALDAARRRGLSALTYYSALGAERVQLAREAGRAEALREADRLKDALLASVSHDIRTPLTTIKALAHDIAGGGDERALVIEEETDRLTRFVTDLLDLSRLQGGALHVSPELAAADDVVGAAVQRLSGTPGNERLHVTLDTEHPLLVGRFDFVHTLRILVNLVENALKYAPGAAPVELRVRRDGADLVFDVADRGPGVPPHERERLFEPFYRSQGMAPDVGSAGLGLSIARRLAEAQGGSLAVEDRPGGGSVFRLRVPAADLGPGSDGGGMPP